MIGGIRVAEVAFNMENSALTIKRKDSKAIPFGELKIGEVFKDFELDIILMKIEPVRLSCNDVIRNAICLESGLTFLLHKGRKSIQI